MSATRLEIDVKRLLSVCEEMAQNNSSDDWRLSKVDIFIQIPTSATSLVLNFVVSNECLIVNNYHFNKFNKIRSYLSSV